MVCMCCEYKPARGEVRVSDEGEKFIARLSFYYIFEMKYLRDGPMTAFEPNTARAVFVLIMFM